MTASAPDDRSRQERDLEYRVHTLGARNVKLAELLQESRRQLEVIREEIARLGTPPSTYGLLLAIHRPARNDAPVTAVDVHTAGRRMMLTLSPDIDVRGLRAGQVVRLNEALTVVELCGAERLGETAIFREHLPGDRALVLTRTDEERIMLLSTDLVAVEPALRHGDTLLVDGKAGVAFERIPKAEVEDLLLEEVPDVDYTDIGGLGRQLEQIRDAVELPFLHADLYRDFELRPPKGVLLYGPPGCGKTLIAKAVARSLARKFAERQGTAGGTLDEGEPRSYFLSIKGPELLNKYVGETERHIRLLFQRAREMADAGLPVIIFFDEMESIFRTRGSGVSSDVETTIVPQLLAEIDGVEGLENVIVIGASNREDMIDPAILRPGRLDVKIRVERPDAEAARDILAKYLTPDLPLDAADLAAAGGDRAACVAELIDAIVERMYATSPENAFVEVTYASGRNEVLYHRDVASGAMLANTVDRAKKAAIKQVIETGAGGIGRRHLLDAVATEFAENEDLTGAATPDEWARVSGRKGERVIYLKPLAGVARAAAPEDAPITILDTDLLG